MSSDTDSAIESGEDRSVSTAKIGAKEYNADDPLLQKQYKSKSLPDVQVAVTDDLLNDLDPGEILPVIVRLNVPFKPEGMLSPQEIEKQRQEIQNAQDNLLDELATLNVTDVTRYKYIPYIAMHVDEQALLELKESGNVLNVVEDIPQPPSLMDSAPLVGADEAWSSGYTGENYALGILDTGVELDHEFFDNRFANQACFSSNVPERDAESLCPNGEERDYSQGSGDHIDNSIAGHQHGTHVAGIAAGDGSDFSGIARGAQLISVQVFSKFNNSNDCGFSGAPCTRSFVSDQMEALEWIYEISESTDIAAVNLSLAGSVKSSHCDDDPRKSAIDNLRSHYIATVAAAGNGGHTDALSRPACISTAISVGATDKSDNHTSYSNSASFLDLLAPGSSITSAVPGGNYDKKSGTSASAAHVSGAWTVVRQSNPPANVARVLQALANNGQPVQNDRNGVTKPRIQVDASVSSTKKNKQMVYRDHLNDPWINTSWNASVSFDGTNRVFNGSNSIRVDQNAWGSLSLRNESWNSTVGINHKYVVFQINPEQQASIDLRLENDAGDDFPRYRYGTISADQWTQISVPMSELNPDEHAAHRIDILETSGSSVTYYVDHYRITNNKPESEPDPGDLTIYDESLNDPWINASWKSETDFSNTSRAYSGSQSVRVDQDTWGALSVHSGSWNSPKPVQPGTYSKVEFAIYAPNNSVIIDLRLGNDQDDESFSQQRFGTIETGSWTIVSMSLSELNPDGYSFDRINIKESSGEPRVYFVDKLRLIE